MKASSLLDAVVIASGGWAGDVPFVAHDVYDDEDGAKQAMRNAEICERMIRMNYFPVVAGSLVGPRFVKRGGAFFFNYTLVRRKSPDAVRCTKSLPLMHPSPLTHFERSFLYTPNRPIRHDRCLSRPVAHARHARVRFRQVRRSSLPSIVGSRHARE